MVSIGFIAAIILGPVLVVATVAAGLWFAHRRANVDDCDLVADLDRSLYLIAAIGSFILAAALACGFALGLYPYDMQYHSYRPITGTVESTEARMLSDGKATSQNYAVQLADGQTYRCDDTRCSLLKPGDHLTLRCIREWQYASTDGWNCVFVANEKTTPTK